MKKKLTIISILCLAFSSLAGAQGTTNDLDPEFGGRLSVGMDKKIVKGFHWTLDGEIRSQDNFSDLGRYQFGTGLTYKISDFFKVGAGYIYISNKNTADVWKPRHRVYGDATFSLRTGNWRFALKERLQLTHRDVGNPFQKVPNLVALKSRIKVSYKANPTITSYAYLELRNVFNDPACSATWNSGSQTYSDYSFTGYTDTHFDRLRGSVGAEWKLNKQNAFEFYLLGDLNKEKNIDTNAEGTKLKSLTYDRQFFGGIGIGYVFSF